MPLNIMMYFEERDKVIDGAIRHFNHAVNNVYVFPKLNGYYVGKPEMYICMITFKFAGDHIFLMGKN